MKKSNNIDDYSTGITCLLQQAVTRILSSLYIAGLCYNVLYFTNLH